MKKRVLALLLSALMLFGTVATAQTESREYELFELILNYAANLYIDEEITPDAIMEEALRNVLKDDPELMTKLIKAGFESLDPYCEFYTQEEFELFNKNLNRIVYGIGVVIQEVDGYVTVMSCVEGGGAQKAGVMAGDKISKVDGVDVKGASIDKVQDLVLGELGTSVTVTFIRGDEEFTRTIEREEVKGDTIAYQVLEGNIGYLYISTFAEDTDYEVLDALYEFDEQGVTDIILDLRDNPGGYMDSAVNIASLFVPKGTIVSTVFRNEMNNDTYTSTLEEVKYDLAVLINENTASASEILASAIGDSDAGILIGNTTYGKGVIQEMFRFFDGSAFKITTGRYFTRNGQDINENGITPDKEVDLGTRRIDVTKYQTFDYVEKPKVGEVSANVRAAKERLKFMGYYNGKVDENFDEALEKAVAKFQGDNELYPYGVLDISTQVKMENIFYKQEELVDYQLYAAYEHFGGDPKIFE